MDATLKRITIKHATMKFSPPNDANVRHNDLRNIVDLPYDSFPCQSPLRFIIPHTLITFFSREWVDVQKNVKQFLYQHAKAIKGEE